MADLIAKRQHRTVPLGPGGTLADYVPFYFTPSSIMLFNIKTGRNRVIQRPNGAIAVLVSSLPRLTQAGVPFVFTNGHAYAQESDYFEDPADVDRIDWDLLRRRDFKADADDPGKLGRYQAEALAYRQVPVQALLGLACFNEPARASLAAAVNSRGLSLPVQARPDWYF